MKTYNLIQVKENLPEILDRIAECKKLARSHLFVYHMCVQDCIYETTHEWFDGGEFTTYEFMTDLWNKYLNFLAEAEYLQKLVDQLKNDLSVVRS